MICRHARISWCKHSGHRFRLDGIANLGAGSVKLSWHADSNAPSKAPVTSSQTAQNEKKTVGHHEDGPPSPRPEDVNEDSGWGNEEDDMGMF